jgi:hypothetical protein
VHVSEAPGNWAVNFIMVAPDVFNIITAVPPPPNIQEGKRSNLAYIVWQIALGDGEAI